MILYHDLKEVVWNPLSIIKMVSINFGISSYSKHMPGVALEERIMQVPEGSELPNCPAREYLDEIEAEPRIFSLWNYQDCRNNTYTKLPAVLFRLRADKQDISEMYLIWLQPREEWIAVQHRKWIEACCHTDEAERGPYSLDEYCKKMLSMAYGVDKDLIEGDIARIGPSTLEGQG